MVFFIYWQVLFKNLGVDMKDVKVSQLLKGRPREIEGNPDFSNKDVAIAHPPALYTTESAPSSAAPMAHVDLPSEASISSSHPVLPPTSVSQVCYAFPRRLIKFGSSTWSIKSILLLCACRHNSGLPTFQQVSLFQKKKNWLH